jgi:hypothetical protein
VTFVRAEKVQLVCVRRSRLSKGRCKQSVHNQFGVVKLYLRIYIFPRLMMLLMCISNTHTPSHTHTCDFSKLNTQHSLVPVLSAVSQTLVTLSLAGCSRVSNRTLEAVAKCVELKELSLRRCDMISRPGFQALSTIAHQLTTLDFGLCAASVIDENIQGLAFSNPCSGGSAKFSPGGGALTSILDGGFEMKENVSGSDNVFEHNDASCSAKTPQLALQQLDLSWCRLSSSSIAWVCSRCHLCKLNLSNSLVTSK